MVARKKPVMETVARRIQKSSGVRLMFFHDRCTSTRISAHPGFANVHTVSASALWFDTRFSILDSFALCPDGRVLGVDVDVVAAPLSPPHCPSVDSEDHGTCMT